MINILIVDDSSIIRKILTKNLNQMNLKVIGEAKDGKEAIKLYEELKPDLVTMDVTMPVLNGLEALKAIIEKDKEAKIIMITSHGEERLVMDAITSGAKGYILKPISTQKIEEVIIKVFPNL